MGLWQYLEHGGKRAIVAWHRRAGKDEVMMHHLCISAMLKPATYWHMLPEQTQARRAIWEAVNPHTGIRRIDECYPVELRETTRENEMMIRLKNGSTISVVGSDNYNSLVGSPPFGVVFSEWALANPAAWAYISPILRENGGWAAFISTPRGKNHFHSMLAMGRQQGWFAEVLGARDTSVFTNEGLEAERAELVGTYGADMGTALWEQEYNCSFDAAILGAFWGAEMALAEREGRVTGVAVDPHLPVHTAWDLGVGQNLAVWFWQAVAGKIAVVDFYQSNTGSIEEAAAVIVAKGWRRGDDWVPHDARARDIGTGRTRVETMIRAGLKPKLVPDHKVDDGINAARQTIARCHFSAEPCSDGIEALKAYRREWDEKLRTFKDTAVHDWASHCFHADTLVLTRNGTHPISMLPDVGEVLTPCGWRAYRNPRVTMLNAPLVEVRFSGGHTVKCTPDHLFLTADGWTSASLLQKGSVIRSTLTRSHGISTAASTAFGQMRRISRVVARSYTERLGEWLSGKSLMGATSTIGMEIRLTTGSPTWSAFQQPNTWLWSVKRELQTARCLQSGRSHVSAPQSGTVQKKGGFGIVAMLSALRAGRSGSALSGRVTGAATSSWRLTAKAAIRRSFATLTAKPLTIESVTPLNERADVWDITVPGVECFSLANGAVVHNSADAFRYLSMAWRELGGNAAPEKGRLLGVGPHSNVTLEDFWDLRQKRRVRY